MKRSAIKTALALIILCGLPVSIPILSAFNPTAKAQNASNLNAVSASSPFGGVELISAQQMKAYLEFIASDELEGRDTPSRGLDTAAKFIAAELTRWGLKPVGANGSFFQKIALRRTKTDAQKTALAINGRNYSFGSDFISYLSEGTAEGPVAYVGHGWVIKAKNINAYQNFDVKGKILISNGSLPQGATFADLNGKAGEDWDNVFSYGKRNGAKGVILIPNFQLLNGWDNLKKNVSEKGTVEVEAFIKNDAQQLPVIIPSLKTMADLFQGEEKNAGTIFDRGSADAIEPFDLNSNKKVSFTVSLKTETLSTQNVVAVIEGTDPTLKNEYVAIGAHYDHVGIGRPVDGDEIYNGADDDGSGTVAVMAMAEAFARGPKPKRSILFVWHCGEEKGLWGSRYITDNPVVPLDKIITQLNIDMIGRSKKAGDPSSSNVQLSGENEIYVIGSKMMSAELGDLSERVNKTYLNLSFNYQFDDPKDPEKYFYRSDHFCYARKGIPIIFYFNGAHEDYHRPSDSVD